jgi:hypothetical protein
MRLALFKLLKVWRLFGPGFFPPGAGVDAPEVACCLVSPMYGTYSTVQYSTVQYSTVQYSSWLKETQLARREL